MKPELQSSAPVPRISCYYERHFFVKIVMLAVTLLLAVRTVEYFSYAARAIEYPFQFDYGEGIVWQQALLIPGSRMYGDITQFPYIVFHYTPLYHLLVRVLVSFGIDPLVAGRGVTFASTIAIAVIASAIVATAMQESVSTTGQIVGAAVAGLLMFTYRPVEEWAVFMRVDMLAICFSIAGVYLAIIAGQRMSISCGAILLFVLAIYTKQTEVSAATAGVLVMLIVNARSLLKASALGFFVGGTAFIILQLSTGGGFWHHIFEYNLHNRFSFDLILMWIWAVKGNGLGVFLGVVALGFLWRNEFAAIPTFHLTGWIETIRRSRRLRALAILSLWFLFASVQLVSLGKFGSNINYFIEWMCITTVPIGMITSLAWDRAATRDNVVRLAGWAGLLLSLALAVHTLRRSIVEYHIVDDANETALRIHLVNLIRENPKPTLSVDMVLLMRAGQAVPIEPGIFTELTLNGIWDERPFLNLIRDRAFGLIILENDLQPFTDEMMSAMSSNYPLIEDFGYYQVRRPAEP